MPHEPAAGRLRAVLDTNIYVSLSPIRTAGQRCSGTPRWTTTSGFLSLLKSSASWLKCSVPISTGKSRACRRLFGSWRNVAEIVIPKSRVAVVASDPDDDRILECAIGGKADVIVSNDHHLLDLKIYREIPIIAAANFRRALGLA
jgi:uncharacterized protein